MDLNLTDRLMHVRRAYTRGRFKPYPKGRPSQRAELTQPEAGEGGHDVEGDVLLVGGVRGEQHGLGGLEHVEVIAHRPRLALDVDERVPCDLPNARGAACRSPRPSTAAC